MPCPHHFRICQDKMNDNKLAMVADMMNEWTRTENNASRILIDLQAKQVSDRNRYIAELQEDFRRLAQLCEIQRNALRDFAIAVEIQQTKLNEHFQDDNEAFLVAQDMHHVPHVIRVDRTQWDTPTVIDLTTDEELSQEF